MYNTKDDPNVAMIRLIYVNAMSLVGTKRQFARRSDMSGVGGTPEVIGQLQKRRF